MAPELGVAEGLSAPGDRISAGADAGDTDRPALAGDVEFGAGIAVAHDELFREVSTCATYAGHPGCTSGGCHESTAHTGARSVSEHKEERRDDDKGRRCDDH